MSDIQQLMNELAEFNRERNWLGFHKPKDLVLSLMAEMGELAECYQWLDDKTIEDLHQDPEKSIKVEEEIADIFIYLLTLSNTLGVNPAEIIKRKIKKNARKYPIDKIKGKHTNAVLGAKVDG